MDVPPEDVVASSGSSTDLAVMTLVGLAATLLQHDRSGIPPGPDHEAAQAASPIRTMTRG